MSASRRAVRARSLLLRGGLLLLIWWLLSDGTAASWWIGGPAVLLALLVSMSLVPPVPLVWHELLRFVPFFLLRSLLGGADVAWRAFVPGPPLAPALIVYPLRLPPGLARVFMANTVSLLPGTLSAELGAEDLTIHVIDGCKDCLTEIQAVERGLARLFDLPLSALPAEIPKPLPEGG